MRSVYHFKVNRLEYFCVYFTVLTHHPLLLTHHPSLTTPRSPPLAHHPPLTTLHSPPFTHHPSLTIPHSPPFTHHSRGCRSLFRHMSGGQFIYARNVSTRYPGRRYIIWAGYGWQHGRHLGGWPTVARTYRTDIKKSCSFCWSLRFCLFIKNIYFSNVYYIINKDRISSKTFLLFLYINSDFVPYFMQRFS